MNRLIVPAAAVFAFLLLNTCGDAGSTTEPDFARKTAGGGDTRLVSMMDGCDRESFDAAVGAGTCARNGGVTFDHFLKLLGKHQSTGAWHFSPGTLNARVGQTLHATNKGGEVHTFTEVEEFGGGIIPALNALSGNHVPAPECLALAAGDFVPPGASYTEEVEEPGTELYECCIHPWMRLTVHAR